MALPLSALVRNAFHAFRSILFPVTVLALLAAVLAMCVQLWTVMETDRVFRGGLESLGMDVQRMEELYGRMGEGDATAMEELMQEMEGMSTRLEGMSEEQRAALFRAEGRRMALRAAPFMVVSLAMIAAVSLLSCCGYLILAVEGFRGWKRLAARVRSALLPLMGVWLWSFLRSFAWVPLIGPLIALFLGPRFALSSVIYLQERKSTVMGAVASSYECSKGYWGKIVGNMLMVGLFLIVLSWALLLVIGTFSAFVPALGFLLSGFVVQLEIAFYAVFLVHLSRTVLENRLVAAHRSS